MIRVAELFAGVGGFRLGLEDASPQYRTVWSVQWEPGRKDQFAYKCYERHFGDTDSDDRNEDIAKVKGTVPDIDMVVGGFPCQDYSVANSGAEGITGRKGVLWWEVYDIIRARRPPFVLLENVDRLLRSPSKQAGRDFAIILKCLAMEGYCAEWRVINAADYGHPQRRRRTFIFAIRHDDPAADIYGCASEDILCRRGLFSRRFPVSTDIRFGTTAVHDLGPLSLQAVSDGFRGTFHTAGYMGPTGRVYTRAVKAVYDGPVRTLGDVLISVPDSVPLDMERWETAKGAKRKERVKNGHRYIYSEGSIPFPDPSDRPSRTMLTTEGRVSRTSHAVKDPVTGRLRVLDPMECERLNGFPDGWTEGMSPAQRYFSMGNALVVPLVTAMGEALLEMMDEGRR